MDIMDRVSQSLVLCHLALLHSIEATGVVAAIVNKNNNKKKEKIRKHACLQGSYIHAPNCQTLSVSVYHVENVVLLEVDSGTVLRRVQLEC